MLVIKLSIASRGRDEIDARLLAQTLLTVAKTLGNPNLTLELDFTKSVKRKKKKKL